MKIKYEHGLILTTLEITYRGKSKIVDNIVIDTGASHTLISQDAVDDIDIRVSVEDTIVTSYGIGGKEHAFSKKVDRVLLGEYKADNTTIDFSSFPYHDINGLLGLDILLKAGFVIDLKNLEINLHT